MATKCIDQIAVPVTTAAAAAQTRPFSPGWARARRSRSRAAQAATTGTASEAATPIGLWPPIRLDMRRPYHRPFGCLPISNSPVTQDTARTTTRKNGEVAVGAPAGNTSRRRDDAAAAVAPGLGDGRSDAHRPGRSAG